MVISLCVTIFNVTVGGSLRYSSNTCAKRLGGVQPNIRSDPLLGRSAETAACTFTNLQLRFRRVLRVRLRNGKRKPRKRPTRSPGVMSGSVSKRLSITGRRYATRILYPRPLTPVISSPTPSAAFANPPALPGLPPLGELPSTFARENNKTGKFPHSAYRPHPRRKRKE